MRLWDRLRGCDDTRTEAVKRALSHDRAARMEMLTVVSNLEEVLARLSRLPDTQANRAGRNQGEKQ